MQIHRGCTGDLLMPLPSRSVVVPIRKKPVTLGFMSATPVAQGGLPNDLQTHDPDVVDDSTVSENWNQRAFNEDNVSLF
jgi:hypothetical protein